LSLNFLIEESLLIWFQSKGNETSSDYLFVEIGQAIEFQDHVHKVGKVAEAGLQLVQSPVFAVKVQTETRQGGTFERNQIIRLVVKAGQFHGPGSRQILKKDERTYIHTRSGQVCHLSEGVQVDIVELVCEKIPAKLDQRRKKKLRVEGIIRFLKRNNSK